jgi:hypothetical protein
MGVSARPASAPRMPLVSRCRQRHPPLRRELPCARAHRRHEVPGQDGPPVDGRYKIPPSVIRL